MTDKILIDRSVVEQALGALESGIQYDYHGNPYSDNDAARCVAYDALHAALEQPDTKTVSEPVAWRCFDGEGDFEYCSKEPSEETRAWSARYNREWEPLYIHPQPQVEHEPVAWMNAARDMTYIYGPYYSDDIPLYVHPQPPRQPLTDEEIFNAIRPLCNNDTNCHAIIGISIDEYRAIERAHGIGGEA